MAHLLSVSRLNYTNALCLSVASFLSNAMMNHQMTLSSTLGSKVKDISDLSLQFAGNQVDLF